LIYKMFFIPHVFSERNDYGVSLLGFAKDETFWGALFSQEAALYKFIIKFFSQIFNGISLDFIANFHILLSFINCFVIFLLVLLLFKDKIIASYSALFYIISPIIFIISLTEDYTNIALFFSFQAILFLIVYFSNKSLSFLYFSIVSSILAIYSRPEYVVFAFLFIFFILLFKNNFKQGDFKKILLFYSLLVIPRVFQTILIFISKIPSDPGINSLLVNPGDGVLVTLFKHLFVFTNNFRDNLFQLFELKTLMGWFIIIFLLTLFSIKLKKFKKQILFFFLYLIVFFLYYSYFHNQGFVYGYKYLSSLVFPLAVFAGIGFSVLHDKFSLAGKVLFIFIFSYSMLAVSPIMKNKISFKTYFNNNASIDIAIINKEYDLFQDNENKINCNGLFINNGRVSLLDSALPIRKKNIINADFGKDPLASIKEFFKENNNRPMYISQGSRAFIYEPPLINGVFSPSCFISMDPDGFEAVINEYFDIDKVIFSFYTDDNFRVNNYFHIFLYQVSLKKEFRI
ncbi:glycosyltransferase family 39 protein, partial [bacterium]|nr:glycosyltransferase family 39 protein [bacterium]